MHIHVSSTPITNTKIIIHSGPDSAKKMAKKTASMGRQRIPIAKIAKKSHRQVTFSKRRAGLFKKASELCTLCGAEIAIVVFSPACKAFSFGHPEVESIVDRFLTKNPPPNQPTNAAHQLVEAHRNANVLELNSHLTRLLGLLAAEKKRGEELELAKNASRRHCWWENPVEELGLNQLQQLKNALEELKKNVGRQANRILVQSANPSASMAMEVNDNSNHYEYKVNEMNQKMMNNINGGSTFSHVYNFGYGHGFYG